MVARPNERWSLDFVHDQIVGRRRFRVLNLIDDVTRECLAAVVDNGTELTSNAVLSWAGEVGIDWHYIAP